MHQANNFDLLRLVDTYPWLTLVLTTLIEKRCLDKCSHYRWVEQATEVLPKA